MRRPRFIAQQSSHPKGLMGRAIARIMSRETSRLNDAALDLLDLRDDDRLLEVGIGHGRTVEKAAERLTNGYVAGIDVSAEMTRMAGRRNADAIRDGRVDIRVGSSSHVEFPDDAFTKALAVHTIYFWEDPATDLAELRRVIRPEGRFVLGFTPSGASHAGHFPGDIYRFASRDELVEMLAAAGFDVETEVPDAGAGALLSLR